MPLRKANAETQRKARENAEKIKLFEGGLGTAGLIRIGFSAFSALLCVSALAVAVG
jgi:hypothetical protein